MLHVIRQDDVLSSFYRAQNSACICLIGLLFFVIRLCNSRDSPDLSFIPEEPNHGWMVGTRGAVFESLDYGKTWAPRSFQNLDPEEEINYRFQVISFKGKEGWVIGKPSILLHTRDGGKSWERVSLSSKLPGDPCAITALGKDSAEMTTTAGAVYSTTNGGLNWKAQVREAELVSREESSRRGSSESGGLGAIKIASVFLIHLH